MISWNRGDDPWAVAIAFAKRQQIGDDEVAVIRDFMLAQQSVAALASSSITTSQMIASRLRKQPIYTPAGGGRSPGDASGAGSMSFDRPPTPPFIKNLKQATEDRWDEFQSGKSKSWKKWEEQQTSKKAVALFQTSPTKDA